MGEQRIADRTHLIRDMTEQLRVSKKDTVKKQYFISLIQKRKKLLRKLQERDSAAYHAIIKKMEIPPLQSYWESHHRHTSRKRKRLWCREFKLLNSVLIFFIFLGTYFAFARVPR